MEISVEELNKLVTEKVQAELNHQPQKRRSLWTDIGKEIDRNLSGWPEYRLSQVKQSIATIVRYRFDLNGVLWGVDKDNVNEVWDVVEQLLAIANAHKDIEALKDGE